MERQQRAEELAVQILKYARNELLVAFRFLDLALCKPELKAGDIGYRREISPLQPGLHI